MPMCRFSIGLQLSKCFGYHAGVRRITCFTIGVIPPHSGFNALLICAFLIVLVFSFVSCKEVILLPPPHSGCHSSGDGIIIETEAVLPDDYDGEEPVVSIPAMAEGTVIESAAQLSQYVFVPEELELEDWYTDDTCKEKVVFPLIITPSTKLYAKFEVKVPMIEYKAVFTFEEGREVPEEITNLPQSEPAADKTEITLPVDNPKAEDFTFVGWYSDEAHTELVEETTIEVDPAKGITLYAWFLQSEVSVDDGVHEPITYFAATRDAATAASLGVSAGGYYEVREDSVEYENSGNRAISKDFYIPATILGIPTEIGERAFWSVDFGDNVDVDINVRNIGNNAFESCNFGQYATKDSISYSFIVKGDNGLDGRIGSNAFSSAAFGQYAQTEIDVTITNNGTVEGYAFGSTDFFEGTENDSSVIMDLGKLASFSFDSSTFFDSSMSGTPEATVEITAAYASSYAFSSVEFFASSDSGPATQQ